MNSSEVLTYNNRLNQSKEDLERYASYFRGKNYFDGNDGAQNTLVFQTMQKRFNLLNQDQIDKWKSKGLSNQYLNLVGTVGDIVLSKPVKPMHVIFNRKGALIQDDNDIIAVGPIANIYIVYKTSPKTINSSFVFGDCLFGAIKITILILILINGNILVMVLDLIQLVVLHTQMTEKMLKMLLCSELI